MYNSHSVAKHIEGLVIRLKCKHLGGLIRKRATSREDHRRINRREVARKPEIRQLTHSRPRIERHEERISRLQVSVHDPRLVQVRHRLGDIEEASQLGRVSHLCLVLRLEHAAEAAVRAVLRHDRELPRDVRRADKEDYRRVPHDLEQLDLFHKLLEHLPGVLLLVLQHLHGDGLGAVLPAVHDPVPALPDRLFLEGDLVGVDTHRVFAADFARQRRRDGVGLGRLARGFGALRGRNDGYPGIERRGALERERERQRHGPARGEHPGRGGHREGVLLGNV